MPADNPIHVQVGDLVFVDPISDFVKNVVDKYGLPVKVMKIREDSLMITNTSCKSLYDDTFHWGAWIPYDEATFKKVEAA